MISSVERLCYRNFFQLSKYKYIPSSISPLRLQHQCAQISDELCEYPPITDYSEEGRKKNNRQIWYNSIKALPTVDEKLTDVISRQRLKLKKYLLSPIPATYGALFFQRYITRTHLIRGIPERLSHINVDRELSDIKDVFSDTILNHYCSNWKCSEQNNVSAAAWKKEAPAQLVKQLVSHCYKKLSLRNDHMWNSTIHHSPRIESFFWHQGFESRCNKLHEENLCFQYEDVPSFIIRSKLPLNPILEMNDPVCATAEVPDYNYHPKTHGIGFDRKTLTTTPGFWPGDPYDFPFLVVKTSDEINKLLRVIEKYDLSKIEDSVGIMSSFGILNSFAFQLGFNPFNDVTYPLTTQTILTNGQDFTFFVYQLNTIAFHSDVDEKDRRNVCWSSGKLRLFDAVEDGVLKGVNDDVYRILLQFLLNTPVPQDNLVLRPYLGFDTRPEDQMVAERYLLRERINKVPHPNAHMDEIPTWVRIYKMHPDAPPSPYLRLF